MRASAPVLSCPLIGGAPPTVSRRPDTLLPVGCGRKSRARSPGGERALRPLPPPQRHQRIFATWEGLKSGEAMRIINDHDPKPLRYQFEAEYAGHHAWEYEQQGPKDWQVKITRK